MGDQMRQWLSFPAGAVLALCLFVAPDGAFGLSHTTSTALSLEPGSFVALTGNQQNYPPGTEIHGAFDDVGQLVLEDFFVPTIDADINTRFIFDVVPDTIRATVFQDGTVETEEFLITITRQAQGSPDAGPSPFPFVLTTGSVTRGPCGQAAPLTSNGTALDFNTGTATMIGSVCIHELGDNTAYDQVFSILLAGTFDPVPTPVPEPSTAALLALGLLATLRAARSTCGK
jgi:hypothetical protein